VRSEREIEESVCEYALFKHILVLKLNIQGRRGWPDRLFLHKGQVLFIEFKCLGEHPRKLQEYIHAILRRNGFHVSVVDNVVDGIVAIDTFTSRCEDV